MLQPPKSTESPPFRITRASHLVYTVRDLSRSREFYTEVLDLVVSDEDRNTLYLRGVEERVHHSLVLKRTDQTPACIRAGLRVEDEEDLEKAKFWFEQRGMPAEFVELPHQGRTLHTTDVAGTPLELYSTITRAERLDQRFETCAAAARCASTTTKSPRRTFSRPRASMPNSGFASWTTWSCRDSRSAYFCTSRRRRTTLCLSAGLDQPCITTATSSAV
jgi:catechol 2,3-dioxygenase-like lactoylglutathione lyase family enzyme